MSPLTRSATAGEAISRIGSTGTRSSATRGSPTMSSVRASICESPAGVSASPRNISVTTLTFLDSPKNSSSSAAALTMGCSAGRNSKDAPSVGGTRRVVPAAITAVMRTITRIVSHGRAVTSRLNRLSISCMEYLSVCGLAPAHGPRRSVSLACLSVPVERSSVLVERSARLRSLRPHSLVCLSVPVDARGYPRTSSLARRWRRQPTRRR